MPRKINVVPTVSREIGLGWGPLPSAHARHLDIVLGSQCDLAPAGHAPSNA